MKTQEQILDMYIETLREILNESDYRPASRDGSKALPAEHNEANK